MAELLVAIAIVVGLLVLTQAPALFSTATLIAWGIRLIAGGFIFGIPVAIYYHFRLLSLVGWQRMQGARWWADPRSLHSLVNPQQASHLNRWFFLGALGFVACVVGCVLVALGLFVS